MTNVVVGRRGVVATSMVTAIHLAGCAPSVETPEPSRVSYAIDGVNVTVDAALPTCVLDETKHLLGPNTHLHLFTGERFEPPDRILGGPFQVNIPVGTTLGTHEARFTDLPGRENVWVSYGGTATGRWSAYKGSLTLEETGDVGGRLKMSFARLDLLDSCGHPRVLTNGTIDVHVGSEDAFPVSAVDTGATSEWARLRSTELMENNLIVQLDDRLLACSLVDYGPSVVPADVSGTGRDETVLEVIADCVCDHDEADGTRLPSLAVVASLPISGQGSVVANGPLYFVSVLVDVNGTPDQLDDDELWFSPGKVPALQYHAVGSQLGAPIDIELQAPMQLVFVDQSGGTLTVDPTRTKRMSYAHAYG